MKKDLKARWEKWDNKNPEFYELFKKFTFEAINAGHKKLSAWLVANRIRWESSVATRGEDYKVPNDFIAFYSRKFMKDFPAYSAFFEVRPMKRYYEA